MFHHLFFFSFLFFLVVGCWFVPVDAVFLADTLLKGSEILGRVVEFAQDLADLRDTSKDLFFFFKLLGVDDISFLFFFLQRRGKGKEPGKGSSRSCHP